MANHRTDVLIGQRIRKKRKFLKWSQGDLAEKLPGNPPYQQIQRWERGGAIHARRLLDVAEAMGVSILYFFRTR